MSNHAGVLSIDFLTGFTIFMLSFIWVATMIPGLLIGLNAHTIDFDAVAYRTGVILAEDSGAVGPSAVGGYQGVFPWEFQPDTRDVARFGLAVSKDSPNILNGYKTERFFCQTAFAYPEDYQKRAIFGDYPYLFNISLKETDTNLVRSVGNTPPDNYGYIRRDVKIKQTSNATIDYQKIRDFHYNTTEEVTSHQFSIVLNTTELLNNKNRNPAYQINPFTDKIVINITDLDKTRNTTYVNPPKPVKSLYNITSVRFYQRTHGQTSLSSWGPGAQYQTFLYEDENTTSVLPPVDVRNNVTLIFEPGFFSTVLPNSDIYINLTFGVEPAQCYFNNTQTLPFDYNYDPANVTQPQLKDAVLEVAVW